MSVEELNNSMLSNIKVLPSHSLNTRQRYKLAITLNSTRRPKIIKKYWMQSPAPKVKNIPSRRPQQHDTSQRLEILRHQTLHAICLTSKSRKRRCRQAQRITRQSLRTSTSQELRHLPHQRRTIQPSIRLNRQTSHH